MIKDNRCVEVRWKPYIKEGGMREVRSKPL